MATKQTAGHDNFGDFAPFFADMNDDVLFGKVWSRQEQLSARERSLITVSSLLTQGMEGPLEAHMRLAKANGVTQEQMVEVITQLAFYSGWPKAWNAMGIAKKVFQ